MWLLGGKLQFAGLRLDECSSRLFQLPSQLVDEHLLLTTQRHLTLGVSRPPPQILSTFTLTLNLLSLTLLTQFLLLTDQQRRSGLLQPPQFLVTLNRLTCLTQTLTQLLLLLLLLTS